MKMVRVLEIKKDNDVCYVVVSDIEFGGEMYTTIRLKESEYDNDKIFEGSTLYVRENEEGTIVSGWMMIPVFNLVQPVENDNEDDEI